MEFISIATTAVMPVFIMIMIGYFAKKIGIIGEEFVNQGTKFVFNFALPVMIFNKVSTIDLSQSFSTEQLNLLMFCIIFSILGFIIANIIAKIFIKDKYNLRGNVVGSFVQGAFRSNFVIVGYPILLNMYGDAIVPNMAIATLVTIPLFNILSIFAFAEAGDGKGISRYKETLKNIIKNPLIIGILVGFVAAYLKIKLPPFASSTLNMLGELGTPLALISIGAFFHFDQFYETLKLTALATFFRLIILPIIAWACALLLDFNIMNVILIIVLYGGPTAVSSFPMAKALKGDSVLAGNIVILTSMMCILSYIALISAALSLS